MKTEAFVDKNVPKIERRIIELLYANEKLNKNIFHGDDHLQINLS